MSDTILELSALFLSLFCLVCSLSVRWRLYLPLPKDLLSFFKSQHTAFLIILISLILSAAASVAGTAAYVFRMNAGGAEILHTLYYFFHNFLSVFFALYILVLFGPVREQGKRFFIIFFLPMLIGEILILSNHWTHLCFYIDDSLVYHRSASLWILYAIAGTYTLIGLLYFFRHRNLLSKTDRTALQILISVAIIGVVIQIIWSVPVELFFESIAFLGFMALLEKDVEASDLGMSRRFSNRIVVAICLTFLAVIVMDISMVVQLTSTQTEEIGNVRLDVIRGNLQDTIAEAENEVLRAAIGAEQLISEGASRGELAQYFEDQKVIYSSDESFMNVYIAGSDWHIIPGFEAPEDYHAEERVWYIGARDNPGELYISEPYKDANTGSMCFTVSTMLSDGETVVAVDLNFHKAQESIVQMTKDTDQTAMIITSGGLIAGYTDMSLLGERADEKLPEYTDILRRVLSSNDHNSFRVQMGGKTRIIFSAETDNGWYLVLSENAGTLFADSYRLTAMMTSVNLLMLVVVIVFYAVSTRNQMRAGVALEKSEEFISRLSGSMEEPVTQIVRLSDWKLISDSGNPGETVGKIRESGLQLSDILQNIHSYISFRKAQPDAAAAQESQPAETADVSGSFSRSMRNGIIFILFIAMVIGLYLSISTTVNWGNTRMAREADIYEKQLDQWITQQQSILFMFTDMISARPSLMDDYESAVAFLDDIASRYPDISVCYLANPYAEHNVIMNNGWQPDEDFRPENRTWYKATERSADGFSISAPYLDAQTGYYCITLSRIVNGKKGEFLGIFGVDFFLDKLINVMGESYSSHGYAFLVDPDRTIINHPYGSYQMREDSSVSVEDTEYAEAFHKEGITLLRDYSGQLMACMTRTTKFGFTLLVANHWMDLYGSVVLVTMAFLLLFSICIIIIVLLVNRMIRWQQDVNRQLVEAADAAVSAGQAKSQFLAQMSHEIRTPINAVLGMNEMILSESSDPEILDYAENIQSAGRTLLSLINSILDFSKIEDGKMELIHARYEVLDLIDDMVNMVSERAARKGLELALDIDPSLPRALYGDDMRIRQVITNLLTNAVKYTPSGTITLSVKALSLDKDSCQLYVSVADTGIGIREEDISRLFESFLRLDQEKNRNIEGTGLGIAIVQRLLDMMDSRLEVESEYGKGSVFAFRLTQPVVDAEPIGPYEGHQTAVGKAKKSLSLQAPEADILLVDDNEMNLKVAKSLLKRFGIRPDLAGSGMKCLEMTQEKHYDLIFLDHMMPVMDGIQTLHELKERGGFPEDTVIIVLTANAIAGAREQYLKEGFQDYLSKPIEVEALGRMLAEYLPEEKVSYPEELPEESSAERFGKSPAADAAAGPSDSMEMLTAAGFNATDGLCYAAGNKEFYLELLKDFAEGEKDKSAAIRQAYEAEDLANYRILVHALKSNAKQIGAGSLSEMALAQENAAKELDSAAVKAGAEELLAAYAQTAETLKHIPGITEPEAAGDAGTSDISGISETSETSEAGALHEVITGVPVAGALYEEITGTPEAGTPEGGSIDRSKVLELLAQAGNAIENYESEAAQEVLRSLTGAQFRGLVPEESVRAILRALNDFDMFSAGEQLEVLIRELEEKDE